MYFERPALLALLLLIPVKWVLYKTRIFASIRFPLTMGDWQSVPFAWHGPFSFLLSRLSSVCALAAFVCLIFSAASPVRYRQELVFAPSDSTVIFVLDVSPSMAARDMDGKTRLDAARDLISPLVVRRSGTAFGLAAVGSSAALLVPPTLDAKVFSDRLSSLAIGEFGEGSALGLALALAASHCTEEGSSIILLTDGENNAGEIHPATGAALISERKGNLIVIGLGSKGQVPLDYLDPVTGKRMTGMLDSDFDEGALRDLAHAGEGSYVSARDLGSLEVVFSGLEKQIPQSPFLWTKGVTDFLDRPFLFASLLFAALAWLVRRLAMGSII